MSAVSSTSRILRFHRGQDPGLRRIGLSGGGSTKKSLRYGRWDENGEDSPRFTRLDGTPDTNIAALFLHDSVRHPKAETGSPFSLSGKERLK